LGSRLFLVVVLSLLFSRRLRHACVNYVVLRHPRIPSDVITESHHNKCHSNTYALRSSISYPAAGEETE